MLVRETQELFQHILKPGSFSSTDKSEGNPGENESLPEDSPYSAASGRRGVTPAPNVEKPQIKAWQYEMTGHAEQCVDRYLELSGSPESSLKKVATPSIDDH